MADADDDAKAQQQKRMETLTQTMLGEMEAIRRRYQNVYGVPPEYALSATATVLNNALNEIKPSIQIKLVDQMVGILGERRDALMDEGEKPEEPAPKAKAAPKRPSSRIAAKARG